MIWLRRVWSNAVTLLLFTKSDFKTIQCVIEIKDIATRLPCTIAWLWIHILVADLSNQRLPESVCEDKVNKPWRPIPAGRITPRDAQIWLQIAITLALLFSIICNSLQPSTTLMTFLWLYNDLDGSSIGPCQRNLLNAAGFVCFNWGGISVLLGSCTGQVSFTNWIVLLALVVTTTIQVQDLPDMEGDRARKRLTVPLVYGEEVGRWGAAVLAPVWSVVCTIFWRTPIFLAMIPFFISTSMASLIVLRRDQHSDELGWKLWCLWVGSLYLLPLL
ncbi:UbiA prenyltransferase family-domain-containing protein [Xylaria cubensis]|nr:UbiA prenyltransferase family-domain-containing protein [Xylaria cubensis]